MSDQEHRFLGSGVDAPDSFQALSRQGSGGYRGLEVFDNPGCSFVAYTSDEVVAQCPVTGQPDYYECKISLHEPEKLIESKSLKLFFNNIHENAFVNHTGIFCEALAIYIRDQIMAVIEEDNPEKVQVILIQKPRGGISIKAVA